MLKKIIAAVAALAVTLSLAPVASVQAATTETITTQRTTSSESGVATVTSNDNSTVTTIQVVEGGRVTKTITWTFKKDGDAILNNGGSEWSYTTQNGKTTIKSSTPVNNYTATVSTITGTPTVTSTGKTVLVYDTNNRVIQRHYTSASGIYIEYFNAAGTRTGTTTITISTLMSSGVKMGTVTYVDELPANGNTSSSSSNSNSNNGSNSNNCSKTVEAKPASSVSQLPRSTSLERASYKQMKKINKLAKENGWTTRKFKVKSSSSSKVTTVISLKGKPDGDGSTWTFKVKYVQTPDGGYFVQHGKVVSTSGVKGLIKNPGSYY